MKIKSLRSRLVKDSRGSYTVEATINGKSDICPSGKSKGKHEMKTMEPKRAVEKINKLRKEIEGKEFTQDEFDNFLIKKAGNNKSALGANTTTALSMAFCRASADKLYKHIGAIYGNSSFVMPVPLMNVLNGGLHSRNKLAIQEFMLLPTGASSFSEGFHICEEIYNELKAATKEFYSSKDIGDEGGVAPPLEKTEHALNLMDEAVKRTGYEDEISYGIDAASSNFYRNGKYIIDGKKLTTNEMIDFYKDLIEQYNIVYMEDIFHEDDWRSFSEFTKSVGNRIMITGDDLLTTNMERLKHAVKLKACNAMILKVNQIGTVTEALQTAKLAIDNSMKVIVSHRSGESEDSFISDLAVGLGCGFIKAGAPYTSYRLAKYKRLIEIEKETKARYGKI